MLVWADATIDISPINIINIILLISSFTSSFPSVLTSRLLPSSFPPYPESRVPSPASPAESAARPVRLSWTPAADPDHSDPADLDYPDSGPGLPDLHSYSVDPAGPVGPDPAGSVDSDPAGPVGPDPAGSVDSDPADSAAVAAAS